MLEKRLEEARQQGSKLKWKTAMTIIIVTAVCILILGSLSYFKFNLPVDNELDAGSKIKQISESNSEKTRNEFNDLFKQYKDQLSPRLQAVNLEHWNKNALFKINNLEKKMMLSFSKSNYQGALKNAQHLIADVTAILEKSEQIFRENIEAAALFYSDDNYDKASLHVEKALVVAPGSAEALALKKDIEKLRDILPLLKKMKVARVEHDLQNELNLLKQILKINSKRIKETERINYLNQEIKNNDFKKYISSAFAELENKNINDARSHYERAKKIYSKRKELNILLSRISDAEKEYRMHQSIKQAQDAIDQDNWLQAKISFTDVLKDMPENETAVKGLRRSNEILMLQTALDQHIKSPYRLSDNDVLDVVKKILIQAEIASQYSPKIKSQTEQLNKLVLTFNRLIPVTVRSDNITDVQLRGIGKLGVFLHKTIQLKPGNYIFEGTRKGFKSKLLQVQIPYDQNIYSVSIICDESI